MYDLAIIGGGPAGAAAGVYAARKKLKTIFLTKDFGGQSIVSPEIHNWIGTINITGDELAKSLKNHVVHYAGEDLKIKEGYLVNQIIKDSSFFDIVDEANNTYQAKTILITTGSNRKKLKVPGAEEFDQKGLTYCASCDGPMFANKDVVVIGGGNAGFESAGQLLAYCKTVTLLHHRDTFKADPITVETLNKHPNFKAIPKAETIEIVGDKFVTGIKYLDKETESIKELSVSGIFVEIGHTPNTDFVKSIIETNEVGSIITNPKNQRTSTDGIWAAGDCTDGLYHQNNIAAGDAVKALEDIYNYLKLK